MRKKSREMEGLVSLIQRAWSQLDLDTSILLDQLGDPEIELPTTDKNDSELLHRLIHAADPYIYQDPTNIDPLPTLDTDHWSNDKEIEASKKAVLEAISQPLMETNDGSQGEVKCFGEKVESHLADHIAFTTSLLERLVAVLNDGGTLTDNLEATRTIADARESRSKILLLNDAVCKLENELIQKEAKFQLLENSKIYLEKSLHKAMYRIKELEDDSNASGSAAEAKEQSTDAPSSALSNIAANASDKELLRQITILEQQLADSENAKAAAEMDLTERLSRPLIQTDAQVSMRKAMEELRSQNKQRVNAVLQEVSS